MRRNSEGPVEEGSRVFREHENFLETPKQNCFRGDGTKAGFEIYHMHAGSELVNFGFYLGLRNNVDVSMDT